VPSQRTRGGGDRLVQQGANMEAKSGIGETPLQLSARLGRSVTQQVLRELARIKCIMRDATAARERTEQARSQAAAVEAECEPSTTQRSSYPCAPPSVEAAGPGTLRKFLRRLRRLQLAHRLRCFLQTRHAGLLHCPLGGRNECLARSPRHDHIFWIRQYSSRLLHCRLAPHHQLSGLHIFWDRHNSSRLGRHCIRRGTLCRHLRGFFARSSPSLPPSP
jgi:hypothetical protein